LPAQRRVFVSYRRNESRDAAVQLFEELSARQFDVFLDTHSVGRRDGLPVHVVAPAMRLRCRGDARHPRLLREPLDPR